MAEVEEAVDVTWKITVTKKLFGKLDESSDGSANITAGGDVVVTATEGIRGFGRIEVEVTAKYADDPQVKKTVTGFIIGPFVLALRE